MPEPIEIVIRKNQGENAYATGIVANNRAGNKGQSVTDKAILNALISVGKSVANSGISQFGNMTGYTIAQRNVENALTIASYVGQIATTGWVGAILVGVQLTTQGISNAIARDKANQQAEMLYQRSGNVTIDGGRGTYD